MPLLYMRLSVLLAVITAFAPLGTADSEWKSLGPEGGSIVYLAVDPINPLTIYAASSGRSFKSVDGGMSWDSTGFPVGRVIIDPKNNSTLYVATWGHGIFKSADAGATWRPANSGMRDNGFVFSLVISPRSPGTLYASVAWNEIDGGREEVFKSVDGAETWASANAGLPRGGWCCESLTIDPQNPDTLYKSIGDVEADGAGFYVSTDGAASWSRAPAIDAVASGESAAVIDPQDSNTIYAVACKGVGDDCFWTVFKSTDRGASWSEANLGLPVEGIDSLTIDPRNPRTLYAANSVQGVFKTTDGGTTWSNVGSGNGIQTLAIDSQNTATLYVAAPGGVLKSADGGESWNPINSGLRAADIIGLTVDPGNPDTVYALSSGSKAVFKSTDRGASWTALATPANFTRLVIDPRNSSAIYALSPPNYYPSPPPGPPGGGGLYRSPDGGLSWKEVDSGLPTAPFSLALDPVAPGAAYASTGFGIFKTTDGAASWRSIGPGPTAGDRTPLPATTLAIDPKDPSRMYAFSLMSFYQIWKSIDGGVSFGPASSGLPLNPCCASVWALAIDPEDFNTLYAWIHPASSPPGLFKSVDAGANWEAVSPGLPEGPYITGLAIDPVNSSTLYAASSIGVFKSVDRGANWTPVNAGLATPFVNILAVDPRNGTTVYAGTSGGSVFSITFETGWYDMQLQ